MFNRKSILEVVFAAFIIFLILYLFLPPSDVDQNLPEDQLGTPRAAIVDHLSISHPNLEFIETSTSILTEADFDVDYYEGSLVTVDFYRDLALHGYDLIILRVHSAIHLETHATGFFTSEPYSTTKYVSEQLDDQLGRARMSVSPSEEEPAYFAITSKFVRSSMKGRFDNTLIIMMGCDSIVYTDIAEALVDKGALAYIGWSGLVMADYIDRATIRLLQGLITKKQTIDEAGRETMREVGPDPTYNSVMGYYPPEAGNYTVEVE